MEELGLEYTHIEIDKTNKPDSFLELNRNANPLPGVRAKVPLLQHGDVVLCESTVIAEYLATTANHDSTYWPSCPKERAKLRLFMELCGDCFSYLAFTRVPTVEAVQEQYSSLQTNLIQVNAFLEHYHSNPASFTMADAHIAPFVQRCCRILPEPYSPISIAQDLELTHLHSWTQSVLQRKSVVDTAPPEAELDKKRTQLIKRLKRIGAS